MPVYRTPNRRIVEGRTEVTPPGDEIPMGAAISMQVTINPSTP